MKILTLIFLSWIGLAASQAENYTLHEWGTFTTVSGSDGQLLPGLQREEETLPAFVESHEGMANLGAVAGGATIKGYIRPLKNVTVKMETPVIYFYTPEAFQAQVSVGFQGGSISQWYPTRSGGETPLGSVSTTTPGVKLWLPDHGEIDFAKKYQGSIQWDIAVTPPADTDTSQIFRGGETANWLFPRQTDSALVTAKNGTADKFLFYRGVGNFDLPVVFQMHKDRILTIQNRGNAPIPRLFVYELGDGRSARFQLLDVLPSGESTTIDLEKLTAVGQWQKPVYNTVAEALRDAGLYRKEADAMLQTWWQSYFLKPGLRVFWIVPGEFTEKILPLTVQPAPQKIVRVLVGRSEILSPAFEKLLIQAKGFQWLPFNDRFTEAYQARVRQLGVQH